MRISRPTSNPIGDRFLLLLQESSRSVNTLPGREAIGWFLEVALAASYSRCAS